MIMTACQPMSWLSIGRKTQSAGTVIVQLIPPFTGVPGAAPNVFDLSTNPRNFGLGVTHVTRVAYTTGATAHLIGIMRPFNYTWTTATSAANGTTLTVYDDPGVYSTNYKYQIPPSSVVSQVSNNAIASGDYVVYQLKDGTWILDTTTGLSGSTLTLTTNIPNITSGGVAAGSPVYFFGVIGDSDPATGQVNPQTTIAASQTRDSTWADNGSPVVSALHPGDPMIFYSPNGTNAGTLDFISGFYAKY